MAEFGAKSGHPELTTVPWALWSHSGGGQWAGGVMLLHPDREDEYRCDQQSPRDSVPWSDSKWWQEWQQRIHAIEGQSHTARSSATTSRFASWITAKHQPSLTIGDMLDRTEVFPTPRLRSVGNALYSWSSWPSSLFSSLSLSLAHSSHGLPMRTFAVIPAAGHSRRMGRPKLLLPLGDRTIIARLLAALDMPGMAARVAVMRRSDDALRTEVERCGGIVVSPAIDPPDMRSSVQAALEWIRDTFHPAAADAWLLAPADHPVLDRDVVTALLTAFESQRPRLLVPTCDGRRGHPLMARWDTVSDVFALPRDVGLNQLLRAHAAEVCELPVESRSVLCDLDTPEDYERLVRELA